MKFNAKKAIPLICASAIALGAIGALVVVSGNNHVDPSTKKDFKVTFDAGEGNFASGQQTTTEVYAGAHFDEVDQPAVNGEGKLFSGWVDKDTNKPIMRRQTVNKDLNLKATYNAPIGEYCTITFSSGSTGAILRGNVSVAVNIGYFFFMVNRPSAKLDNAIFVGWEYASGELAGELVQENDDIEENLTLVPRFTKALSLTWNGCGAEMYRGTNVSLVEPNTQFRTVNQPGFRKGTEVFEGWYKDEAYTTAWEPTDEITENTNAYAKWVTSPTEDYCTLNFIQKPGTSIVPIFSPSIAQAVLKDKAWSNIFKPTVTTATGDYKVDHWEFSEDGSTNWTTIEDTTEFNYDAVYVAPILVPNVEEVYVYGKDSITTEMNQQYSAFVLGCETQTVNWHVYDTEPTQNNPTPNASTHAVINDQGILTANFINQDSITVYVQAVSAVDTTKKSKPIAVEIQMPYVGSSNVWYNDSNHWYWLDMDELTNPESTSYTSTKLVDGETTTLAKEAQATTFQNVIYIGRNVKSLPNNFMAGWKNFNSLIDFADITDSSGKVIHTKNNVTTIGDSFLEGCINFNKPLDFSNITYIGDHCLYDCNAFNYGVTTSTSTEVFKVSSPYLTHIGNNFMGNCWSFTQHLRLPYDKLLPTDPDPLLTHIGSFFMYNCLKYDKEIYLASTIQTIDPYFMLNCCSFDGSITVNCEADAFVGNDQQICAMGSTFVDPSTSETVDSTIYTNGYFVSGTNKYDFRTKFPDTESSTRHVYRKSATGTESHTLAASSELNSVTMSVDKSVIDESEPFVLTVNNNRTTTLTGWSLELTVGSQHFITSMDDLQAGTSTFNYTKANIDSFLVECGGVAMGKDDAISLNMVRVNCYSVSSNRISYTNNSKVTATISDDEIEALAGRFLIKNAYGEWDLNTNTTTLHNFITAASPTDTNDITLISGTYDTLSGGPSQAITLKISGALDSSKEKTATLNTYGGVGSRISCPNVNFVIDNMNMLGFIEGTYSYYSCGIECPGLKCTNCDFRGGYTLYTANAEFYSCTFDSRGIYYIEGGATKNVYPMFIYGNYSCATINNCTFYSGGKAIKIYADGDLKQDLTNTFRNNTFIYDGTYPEGVAVPSAKCPIEIDATYISSYKYIVYVGGNEKKDYPSEITSLYNIEGDPENTKVKIYTS